MIRVMQSFGAPRSTTNPYIVMLRNSLVSSDEVEHVPFSWKTALLGSYDVFHVHWADTLLSGRSWATRSGKRLAFAALLMRLRLRRTPVVQTVHNLSQPEGPPLDRRLIASLARRTTVHIRINASTRAAPGIASVLIPHGHYRDWYAGMVTSDRIPARLGYIGLIKPYKGVETLIAAFEEAQNSDRALTLEISGRPIDEETASSLQETADRLEGVTVTLRYVEEREFVSAVTRASLVVLPYRHMHNSGTALAALSLDRPVLVPDNPTTRALADEVGPGWVHLFQGELDAEDLLVALANLVDTPIDRPDLSSREWSDAAHSHAEAYRTAIRARQRQVASSPNTHGRTHA